MLKKAIKRIRLNFRSSRSDRAATNSYRNYHQQIKGLISRVNFLKKVNKNK